MIKYFNFYINSFKLQVSVNKILFHKECVSQYNVERMNSVIHL